MRRLLLAALLLLTAACAGDPTPAGPGPAGDAGGAVVADVLPVSCADGLLSIGVERARVQPDGLHVEVAQPLDPGTSVEIRSPDERDLLEAESAGGAQRTGRTVMATVAPGTVLVRRYPHDGPRHMLDITEDDEAMSVEVIDDGDHWTTPERLDCDGAMTQMMSPLYDSEPAPPAEPVEPLAEAVDTTGHEGAEVRARGYAAGTTRWATIVADGRVVSRGTYVRDGTSWRVLGATSCG